MTDSTLNRFLARGTNAQRTAFTPDPGTPPSGPSHGYFWYETDTGNTYAWDGSTWGQVNGGLADGDYGDISISSGVWTVDAGAISYAKMQDVSATNRLLGRVTAGAGDVEEVVLDTDTTLAADSDDIVPTQKAVKAYVDANAGGAPLSALYEEQQAAGTSGGVATAGSWLTRVLNTEVYDDIGITLSSNQLSLPAGTYEIDAESPTYRTGRSRARLQDVTGHTVTMTIASPCVVTWTAHGLVAGTAVTLSTTGALPTGLTAGTTYFVVSPTTNTFQLSATPGGSAINTSGSQSGVHSAFVTLVMGSSIYNATTSGGSGPSRVWGRFTLGSTTLVELQYRVESGFSPNGLGIESNMSYLNIFSRVKLTKLA